MSLLPNHEHWEARQAELNEERRKLIDRLDPEKKKLFLEVLALDEKLTEHNIAHAFFIDDGTHSERYNLWNFNFPTKENHDDVFSVKCLNQARAFVEDLLLSVFIFVKPTHMIDMCFITLPDKDGKFRSARTNDFNKANDATQSDEGEI